MSLSTPDSAGAAGRRNDTAAPRASLPADGERHYDVFMCFHPSESKELAYSLCAPWPTLSPLLTVTV